MSERWREPRPVQFRRAVVEEWRDRREVREGWCWRFRAMLEVRAWDCSLFLNQFTYVVRQFVL
jgi:hypothetical protein